MSVDLLLLRGPHAFILLTVYLLLLRDALVRVVYLIIVLGIAAPLLLRLAMIAGMMLFRFTVPADMCDCFTIFRSLSSDGPSVCGSDEKLIAQGIFFEILK